MSVQNFQFLLQKNLIMKIKANTQNFFDVMQITSFQELRDSGRIMYLGDNELFGTIRNNSQELGEVTPLFPPLTRARCFDFISSNAFYLEVTDSRYNPTLYFGDVRVESRPYIFVPDFGAGKFQVGRSYYTYDHEIYLGRHQKTFVSKQPIKRSINFVNDYSCKGHINSLYNHERTWIPEPDPLATIVRYNIFSFTNFRERADNLISLTSELFPQRENFALGHLLIARLKELNCTPHYGTSGSQKFPQLTAERLIVFRHIMLHYIRIIGSVNKYEHSKAQ